MRLWNPRTGHCEYVLLTHTCADISFDMDKVVTASFDNTIGMWDWKTGQRLQCYQGHTGAGWYGNRLLKFFLTCPLAPVLEDCPFFRGEGRVQGLKLDKPGEKPLVCCKLWVCKG